MTDLLLKHGAKPNMQSQPQASRHQRFTASLRAIKFLRKTNRVLEMYDKLNLVKARLGSGATPLVYAAQCLDLPKVARLLEVVLRTKHCAQIRNMDVLVQTRHKHKHHHHDRGQHQAKCEVNTMDDFGSNALLNAATSVYNAKDGQERTLAQMVFSFSILSFSHFSRPTSIPVADSVDFAVARRHAPQGLQGIRRY